MYLWGRGAGDVVAYQFVLLYQPLSLPTMSLGCLRGDG